MTAGSMLVEVTELTGIDLEGTPPCQLVWISPSEPDIMCGKPSVVRLHATCRTCTKSGTRFYCAECWELLKKGAVFCYYCDASAPTVRET